MEFMIRPNKYLWLWWASAISLSIGVAIYVLLKPAVYDPEVQKIRSMALVVAVLVSGLCIIIGTSKRWFGKDL